MAYSEAYECQTSKMELFAKIGRKPLTIFVKSSILNVWQGYEHASVYIEERFSDQWSFLSKLLIVFEKKLSKYGVFQNGSIKCP